MTPQSPFGDATSRHEESSGLPTISIQESIVAVTPALDDPTENYHEASRAYPGVADPHVRGAELIETSAEVRSSVTRSAKRYATAPIVRLPSPALGAALLNDALANRRSTRSYGTDPVTVSQLGTLLSAAYGVTGRLNGSDQACRTAPSGGALYPLELYVATPHVDGLDAALFHYDPLRHALEHLRPLGARELEPLVMHPELVSDCAALIVTTAMFWRSRFKYGQRAYRFALLEAGHVGQNLSLAATALNLATVPIGGFYDRRVDTFVAADGLNEASLYLFTLGTPVTP